MDRVMDAEENTLKSIEDAENTIRAAKEIMKKMALMRKKLNIKEGAGRRFLQKTKPHEDILQQAEKLIESHYAAIPTPDKNKKKRRKSLVNALFRHGRA